MCLLYDHVDSLNRLKTVMPWRENNRTLQFIIIYSLVKKGRAFAALLCWETLDVLFLTQKYHSLGIILAVILDTCLYYHFHSTCNVQLF